MSKRPLRIVIELDGKRWVAVPPLCGAVRVYPQARGKPPIVWQPSPSQRPDVSVPVTEETN